MLDIVLRSLWISGTATLLATAWGLPLALLLGLREFRGRRALLSLFHTLMGLPTVTLGLLLFLLLSSRGPLGPLHLLYTPSAMILGQALLVTPIVVTFLCEALERVDPSLRDLARTLGASERQASLAVLGEARRGAVLAVLASFNRAVSELGVAMMLGGNLHGYTRVMTTAIALETARGEVLLSLQLAAVLLALVFTLNLAVNLLGRR
ncbi:MAG: ABC transporter permease [Hadesarchaea archaeon]|jgi:tungstate transport system permease protein|nr:MAG: ABC transporter permease [Hadesarchaea archaeon]